MQSPFAFNGLPHIEQTPMPVAKGFPMARVSYISVSTWSSSRNS